MKSVISNTSDSGCGERAGQAVSGASRGRQRESRGTGSGREERDTHSLRCPPPSCAAAAPPSGGGCRERGGGWCLLKARTSLTARRSWAPSQLSFPSQCFSWVLSLSPRWGSCIARFLPPPGSPRRVSLSRPAAAPHGTPAGVVASHRREDEAGTAPTDSPSARVEKGSLRCRSNTALVSQPGAEVSPRTGVPVPA